MPGCLFPDLVGDRVGAISQTRGGLGERERGAFGLGEVRGFSPGRDGETSQVWFVPPLELTDIVYGRN